MFLYNKKNIFYLFIFSLFLSLFFLILFNNINSPNVLFGQVESSYDLNYVPCCGLRTSFYSYFTILLSQISDNIFLTRYVQLFLLILSISFLSLEFFNLTKNKFFSVLLFLSITLNIKFIKLSHLLYEDALYLPFLITVLALLIRVVNNFTFIALGLFSLACGILASIKLSGITIFPFLILLLFFIYNKNTKLFSLLKFAFIPFILMLMLENYLYFSNEEKRVRATIYAISGKLPIISIKDNPNSKYPEIYNVIQKEGEMIRNAISQQPNFSTKLFAQHIFTTAHQDFGLKSEWKESEKFLNLFNENLPENHTDYDKIILLQNIFIDSLKANKIEFIKITMLTYFGFWNLTEIISQKNLTNLELFISNDFFNSLPESVKLHFSKAVDKAQLHVSLSAPSLIISFLLNSISIVLLLMSFFQIFIKKNKNGLYILGLLMAIYTHLYYFSVALVNVAFARYFVTAWPMLMTSLFLFLFLLNKRLKIVSKI